jgi:hypothetical protein
MKYAKYWGAIANHSGDAYFDFVYWHDWPNTLNELAKYRARSARPAARISRATENSKAAWTTGRIKRFLQHVWKNEKLSARKGHAIMNLCMAATYDPDPRAPERLPHPLQRRNRRRSIAERWRNWRRHDPINLVASTAQPEIAARHLHRLRLARPVPHPLRARDSVAAPSAAGIRHTYEEFDDNHSTSTTGWTRACRSSTVR